jgi:hypothetical protein
MLIWGLVKNIDRLNQAQPVDFILLTNPSPNNYTLFIVTKNLLRQSYIFTRLGVVFSVSLSTEGTLWLPKNLVLNTGIQQQVFEMINLFGITDLEVTYK